jgi:hypothetical protein
MPRAKADELRLETRVAGRTVVYGPYEMDYGRQNYGLIVKDGSVFVSQGTDGRELGRHRRKSEAVIAIVEWAEENLTKESVERDFEPRTAGGIPLRFQRRVISLGRTSVVASYLDGERRQWASTSWDGDGVCSICKHDDTEEGLSREMAMRLVSRVPASEMEQAGEEPEEAPAPRF